MACETKTVNEERPAGRPAPPCVMVILGATGDLTKRKLIPALHNLAQSSLLSDNFAVVGFGRRDLSDTAFRKRISEDLRRYATGKLGADVAQWLAERLYYLRGDLADPAAYERLRELLHRVGEERGTKGNCLFYLATSPEFFSVAVEQLGACGLTTESDGKWRRVIIEKPFGSGLDSARALNRQVGNVLDENQTYRIDHYLGKETVQNILVFRFANGIFEPIWNRRYVNHIQITVAEELGVEKRGGYFDGAGTLRDMVPNHIFQLITLTAMEPPISFDADAVRDEQTKILRAIQPMRPEEVLTHTVRGQYGEGTVDGVHRPAYRAEENIPRGSATETYVAMKLDIDNWRWAGVPFYLRTGKRLPRRVTEIAIRFKRAPFVLFQETPVEHLEPNRLVLHLQPDEGISLSFGAKVPGALLRLGTVHMDFAYEDYFGRTPSTGYERLLYDCMLGDATLFQRADMVEAGWSVVQPVLDVWRSLPPRQFPNYPAGSWGPKDADDLLKRDGRKWRLCDD